MSSQKFAHSYDLVGSSSTPATLTASLADNTKYVLIKGLATQMLKAIYSPKAAQANRYLILTVEVSDAPLNAVPPDSSFVPHSAVLISTSPNEVDLVPVVPSVVLARYGTPLILPTNSVSPISTGGTSYRSSYNLNLVGAWMRVSAIESGSADFGTAWVGVGIQE